MLVFIIERFCGFGREPKEVKDPEEDKKTTKLRFSLKKRIMGKKGKYSR